MSLLTLANVTVAYGTHVVLDEVTVSIEAGEKVGLIGRNGCGKTTLMRVMQGDLQPDAGTVQLSRGAAIGYLRQDPNFDPNETVRDAAEGAFARLHELHLEMDAVYHDMADASGDQLDRLLKRQARLETEMEAAGGYAINHRIEASLHGLGFTDQQMTLKTSVLSGGQLSRLGLARLLLEEPDLLLLDEPTNHLDIDGRKWLEQFLADEYRGAVLVVSHDRWLLDRVVSRIVEVDRAGAMEYPGNYHKYVALRDQNRLTHKRTYEKQLDRIRREEQYIRRYKAGQRARQAKGRESKLDRFKEDELVDRPVELDVMRLTLPKAPRSGDQVLSADRVGKRYGDTVLFEDLSISLTRGDRLGIIGPNGAGKTTLVNCLLGDLAPDTGSVSVGSRMSIFKPQLQGHHSGGM
jgi:ATP-binding cassette subfamily F protein 3